MEGENRQRLADADAVRKVKQHVLDLLSDPGTENNGKSMKWVMEELELWEDEPCRN